MSELKLPRLLAAAKEFNIGLDTVIDFLIERGFPKEDLKSTSKLSEEMYRALQMEFKSDRAAKIKSEHLELPKEIISKWKKDKENILTKENDEFKPNKVITEGPNIVKKIDLSAIDSSTRPRKKISEQSIDEKSKIANDANSQEVQRPDTTDEKDAVQETEKPPKILGKIQLPFDSETRPVKDEKRKRKRIPIEKKIQKRNFSGVTWQQVKEKYKPGTEWSLKVKMKAAPGIIFFQVTEQYAGILHVSDLNWNFGLCQLDFRMIRIGVTLKVYVIGHDDNYKKIHLGRKLLKEIEKPSNSFAWKKLELKKETRGVVFEQFRNKVVIQLQSGLFGTIPLQKNNIYQIGESTQVIPVRKNFTQNIIECILNEVALLSEKQTKEVLEMYKQNVSENEFASAELFLNSYNLLSESIYGNYFTPDEREVLKSLFETTTNLFSRVEKAEAPVNFEFEFNSTIYTDFITNIAPAIFELPHKTEGYSEKELLLELSKLGFWYTQFEYVRKALGTNTQINEHYFSLFNEIISIRGIVTDEGALKITGIKAKARAESLKESQLALKKNNIFYIDRPIIFSQYSSSNEFNKIFITTIHNKILAFKLFEIAKTKSLDILQRQGKDFKIFGNYLESQIDYETKINDETEISLTECRLEPGLQIDGITFKAKPEGRLSLKNNDKVLISVQSKEAKTKSNFWGSINSASTEEVKIESNIENIDLLSDGATIKKIFSTKNHDVQIEVLNKFLSNKLPLDTFYKIFHDNAGIESPSDVELEYFNPLFTKKESPQTLAVKKAVGNKNILLIQGPPGTGKTTVITEIVKQLIKEGKKVLVTSQTHIAVDNVLEKIKDDARLNIARIGNLDSVSNIATEYMLEETRKRFAIKIQKVVDMKIELLNLHLQGTDISLYSKSSFELPIVFDWANIENFNSLVKSSNTERCKLLINSLEEWRDVLIKSPILLTDIFLKNLDVVFGTCIGIATNKVFAESDMYFDTVILDEAGKANISETLTAISRAKRIILVGDHKQLPPYLDRDRFENFKKYSKDVIEQRITDDDITKALGASLFEYLQKDKVLPDENKILLAEQHRMHPDIGNFISWTFYNSELSNGEHTIENTIPLPEPFDRQIIFIDTSSDRNSTESFKDGSYYNQVEAGIIVSKIIPEFEKNNIGTESYAILSPYSKQCEVIKELLADKNKELYSSIEVATLDSFQGREHDMIIFSFTRSSFNKTVGFLDDARRLNVALSRAKKKLILIGNAETLLSPHSHEDPYYTKLFQNLWKYAGKYGYVYKLNELDFRRVQTTFNQTEIKNGKIRSINEKVGVFVNLGAKDGLIPISFFLRNPYEFLRVNQNIKVEIINVAPNGRITLNLIDNSEGITTQKNKNVLYYKCFKSQYRAGDVVEGKILKINIQQQHKVQIIFTLIGSVNGFAYLNIKSMKFKVGQVAKFKVEYFNDNNSVVKGNILI